MEPIDNLSLGNTAIMTATRLASKRAAALALR